MDTIDWWPVLLAGLVAFGEAAIGLGVLFPGEVAITALAATLDGRSTVAALTAVAAGASLGDHVGYLVGRRHGARLAHSRLVRRVGTDKWDAGTALMTRYGVPALLVSRLLPFVRTVMPAVAGAARLRYRRFLLASAIGSVLWSAAWVGAGEALHASQALASPAGFVILTFVVVTLLLASRMAIHRLKLSAKPVTGATTPRAAAGPGTASGDR